MWEFFAQLVTKVDFQAALVASCFLGHEGLASGGHTSGLFPNTNHVFQRETVNFCHQNEKDLFGGRGLLTHTHTQFFRERDLNSQHQLVRELALSL